MVIFAAESIAPLSRGAWRFVLSFCLLAAGSAHALGLGGELRVFSALNRPLLAELPLYLAAEEAAADVRVRLADRDAYRRMGLPYHDGLPPLTFEVSTDAAGQPVIRLTSREPMREPALELLLDVRSSGGRLLRRYALLLDPPSLFTPPVAAAPASAPAAAAPAPAAAEKRAAAPAAATYGPVQRGETLSQIAQRLKPEGVGTPQMTVALFEANPHAFIGGNMNRLRWGTTLYLPAPEAIAARSRGAAGRIMLEQQQALQPASAPETESTAAAPALQILTPAVPAGATGDLEQRLQQVRQLNEAVEVENEELRQRLVQLERQARQLAEQVLALPEPPPAAESVPPAPAAVDTPAIATEPRPALVEISTAAPPAWWHNPSWWIVLLGLLLMVCVALLGWLLWRRSRRWQYRDLALALCEDAEAKERARQELLEKARLRLR